MPAVNAANREYVKSADRLAREREAQRRMALHEVLKHYEGRRVLWDLLTASGVFRSIATGPQDIHYLAGRQDFGHELIADIVSVSEDLYQLMEKDARHRAKRAREEDDLAARAHATTDEYGDEPVR
jgi:hypothetical protein